MGFRDVDGLLLLEVADDQLADVGLDLPDAGISLDTASPEQQAAQREKRAYHRQYYHEKRKPKKEAQTAAG